MRRFRFLAAVMTAAVMMAGLLPGQAEEQTLFQERKTQSRLWGVMYRDALLLVRADDGEEETDGQVEFVWPLWQQLLEWLGLKDRKEEAAYIDAATFSSNTMIYKSSKWHVMTR